MYCFDYNKCWACGKREDGETGMNFDKTPVDARPDEGEGKIASLKPDKPIRVVIADDHPIFRRGLYTYLQSCGMDVAGEACNGRSLTRINEPQCAQISVW